MSVEIEEWWHCGHVGIIENYCEGVQYICMRGVLNRSYLPPGICVWMGFLNKGVLSCRNCDTGMRVLLQAMESSAGVKQEIDMKIDKLFEELFKKLARQKVRLKKEMHEKIPGELKGVEVDVEEEETTPDELTNLLIRVQRVENNIRILNEKNEKENLIALLKDNVLRDIEAKLKQKEGKAKIHKFMSPPLLQGDLTSNYYFFLKEDGSGSRICRKQPEQCKGKQFSYCCPVPLPKYFCFRIRINNFVNSTLGVIGMCKKKFGDKEEWLPFDEKSGQFGFCTDGFVHYFKNGERIFQEGNQRVLEQAGDIYTVTYGTKYRLSLQINGARQPNDFTHLWDNQRDSDTFLCASMFYDESEIQIIEVADVEFDEQ